MEKRQTTKQPTYQLVVNLLHHAMHDLEEALRMTHFIGATQTRYYDGIMTGYLRVAWICTTKAHDELRDWVEKTFPTEPPNDGSV